MLSAILLLALLSALLFALGRRLALALCLCLGLVLVLILVFVFVDEFILVLVFILVLILVIICDGFLFVLIFLFGSFAASVTLSAAKIETRRRRINAGHRRTLFGYFIKFISGNPIMPIVSIAGIFFIVMSVFTYFGANNRGVEFFVES